MTLRRKSIAISAAAIFAILTLGVMYPTSYLCSDGVIEGREIRLTCLDPAGKPVANVQLERRIPATRSFRPEEPWRPYGGVTNEQGQLRFAIGGRGFGSVERTYFGFYKTVEDNTPKPEYRATYGGKEHGSWEECQLHRHRINDILPLADTVLGPDFPIRCLRRDRRVESILLDITIYPDGK